MKRRVVPVLLLAGLAAPSSPASASSSAASHEPWSLAAITKCAVVAAEDVVHGEDPDVACLD